MCTNNVTDLMSAAKDSGERWDIANSIIPMNTVIRLYNKGGEHKLSILPCLDGGGFDVANPDGKVLICDVDPNTVEVLAKHLLESF